MVFDKVEDFSKDGKCSRCGECCTNYLPVTDAEFRKLKKWVKQHDFKPVQVENALDGTCPFLDKDTKLCVCYKVRPSVCEAFFCRDYHLGTDLPHRKEAYSVHNLRAELFNEESLSYAEWLAVAEYIRKKGKKPYAVLSDSEQS